MSILLDRREFLSHLEVLIPAISLKGENGIRLLASNDGILHLISSNKEVGIVTSIPNIEINDIFDVCVPFHPLYSLISNLDNPVIEIELDGHIFKVQNSTEKYELNILDGLNLEVKKESDFLFQVKKTELELIFSKVDFACAKEASRYSMNGIYFEVNKRNLLAAGTDGRRLAVSEIRLSQSEINNFNFLLPNKTLGLILKHSTLNDDVLRIGQCGSAIAIIGDKVFIMIQKINGNFPDFKGIIPKDLDTKIRGDLNTLRGLVKRLLIFSDNEYPVVSLKAKGSIFELEAFSNKIGKCSQRMEVHLEGSGGGISFNPKFLYDGIINTEGEEFIFKFSNENSPGVLELNEFSRYIMMPVSKI